MEEDLVIQTSLNEKEPDIVLCFGSMDDGEVDCSDVGNTASFSLELLLSNDEDEISCLSFNEVN